MMRILAFSSIRSDYDLLSPLYALLQADQEVDLKLIVSGAHLSSSYGYSVEQIKKDELDILLEVETLINSDTALSRLKSASILLQNIIEVVNKFKPDLMIYAGDREDVLMYAMIGGYLNIPTIHAYAGDHVEDGYIDNPIRHAAAKLSTAHFVTLEQHKKRLVRMGEDPKRVFVTGNISLDKFVGLKPLSKPQLRDRLNIDNGFDEFCLVIFHPVTEELGYVDEIFDSILLSLKEKNISAFISYPNVDPGNHRLVSVIDKYKNDKFFYFYKNLSRDVFVSIYKNSKFIIGNSSSGIVEAASLKIPAINVGMRQTGRFADRNVIFCGADYQSIKSSIDKAESITFKNSLIDLKNSYGEGCGAIKAYDLIKQIDFKSMIAKKEDPLKVNLL